MKKQKTFERFFALGCPVEESPFLKEGEEIFGHHLEMKIAVLSGVLLLMAALTSGSFSAVLLLFVFFLAGTPSLIVALEDVLILNINIDVLMTLAAYSSIFIGGAYEGGLLLVLFSLSGSLEELVAGKAKGAIEGLKRLSPKKALVIEGAGRFVERAVEEVKTGDHILVRAGEYIPLDGKIVEGRSLVNLVHLTGEAEPLSKGVKDQVPAGALSLDGTLTLEVTHSSLDSTLYRIINLVTEAQEAKPKLEQWFDRFSSRYATSIIGLAASSTIFLPFILGIPVLGDEGSLYRSLAFLIAASPCALILALPTAYLSAISACAKKGILLKGGTVLDSLAICDKIAFDKTGTITTGELELIKVVPVSALISSEEAIAWAASLEKGIKHPVGEALLKEALEFPLVKAENIEVLPGYGVIGKIQGEKVFIGLADWLPSDVRERLGGVIEVEKSLGRTVSVLFSADNLVLFSFQDQLRGLAVETIRTLKDEILLKTYLLTGDHEESGCRVAQAVGIEQSYADLRPEDKLRHVSNLSKDKGLVMVGDGVNDAPALARATVGIAMGKVGTGAALDASDIVLLKDELKDLVWLFRKARQTRLIVRQNLSMALIALLGASLPALMGYVPLWLAVVLHEGGTCLVGLNALRLLKK